jgi:hypothetical protein
VDAIVARLSGPNFFPGSQIPDVTLVVEQEIENLDDLAVPQLVEKLTAVIEGADPIAASNGRRFLLGLASGQDPKRRARIVKSFLILKSSTDLHSQLITELVSLDPNVLKGLPAATKLRVEALLCKNAATAKSPLYAELRNPAHALAAMVAGLGEDFVLSQSLFERPSAVRPI